MHNVENGLPAGDAYGADPTCHHVVGGAFWCSAPEDARCRTFPTCECENWCCCDSPEDVVDNHDGEHCCMTTVKPGQLCWIAVWVDAQGVEDSIDVTYDDEGEPLIPDGPVACDWDDGIYLTRVTSPAKRDDWHEFTEDVDDASMCECGIPALTHDAVFPPEDPVEMRRCDGCGEDYNAFEESHVGHVIPPPGSAEDGAP